MISCFYLKPCVKCFPNLFISFKLKNMVVEPKMTQPVEESAISYSMVLGC